MPSGSPGHWGHSTVHTACPLDCPDSCSLAVSVEEGRVVAIDGSDQTPTTAGFICAKVRNFAARLYGDARVLSPALRIGEKGRGHFRPVTWEEALDRVASRLDAVRREFGGEAILPFYYGGSNGFVTQNAVDLDFFRAIGASRLARTVCAAATSAAAQGLYGKMAGVAYEDYVHARLIVVWGANPSVSGIHLVPFIREARKQGAKLAVLDPRSTPLARQADLHLALRPGTDLPVALSLHRFLFEEGLADQAFLAGHATGVAELRAKAAAWTFERAAEVAGVPASRLRALAELYAASRPAVIRCGWGPERNRNGGSAVAAVLALPAVGGKFGVRGGGYTMSNSAAWGLSHERWSRVPEPATRVVNMNQLGRVLDGAAEPPVKALFVYNANPAATIPDQNAVLRGLSREDLFTVVFDQVLTDTAAYADVVLPAPTFLEQWDVARGYGAYNLQLVRPAVDLVGEARPNAEVFGELARRLGLLGDGEPETEAETLMRVVGAMPGPLGSALMSDSTTATPPAGRTPVQFVDAPPNTPDGKAHLHPEALDREAPHGLYVYQPEPATAGPLALISPASEKTISSTLGELRERPASLYMHVDDAAERGIENGDTVRVFNALGEVQCLVTVGDAIAPGTVSLPKGLWRKSTFNRSTASALAPDSLTDLGGGACFNDARVEVARVLAAALGERPLSIWVMPDGVPGGRDAPRPAS